MVKRLLVAACFSWLTFASHAHAEPANAEPPAEVPALHHAPVVTAHLGDEIQITVQIERPDLMKRALLVVRAGGTPSEVEFQRSSRAEPGYVAVIPATSVRPGLKYAIELETTTGERLAVFATRRNPHPITVLDSADDAREASLLSRLGGRRSVLRASGEYASFGRQTISRPAGAAGAPVPSVVDQFYRTEGSYTYRLLGTVAEFGLRAGVVRGRSVVAGETDPSKYDVGLNYGAPRLRLRFDDWFHIEGEILTSITEVGFSVGGGGALLLGDPYGSKLVLGFEGIQVFGARGYSRFDLVANSRFMLSPIIEVTTMPHADRAGVRLLGELGIELGRGFHLDMRGGYQARTFNVGGLTLGGGLAYAF
jgi:hypothetical protein